MPVLVKTDIQRYINEGKLLTGAARDSDGNPLVEAASYDLRAGIILWKDKSSKQIERRFFDPADTTPPAMVTLAPGQMIFVITHEELALPVTVCATVYSRNKLQKKNILALNAGHIDPHYHGPILIRLINLGATEYALWPGEAIFTVVFHSVTPEESLPMLRRTKEETLESARDAALQAFSNPLFDLYVAEFDKQQGKFKNELRAELDKSYFRTDELWRLFLAFGAGLGVILVAASRIPWKTMWNYVKGLL